MYYVANIKVEYCRDNFSGVQPPASSDADTVNIRPVNQALDVFQWLRLGDYADVRNMPGVHLPDQKGKLKLVAASVRTGHVFTSVYLPTWEEGHPLALSRFCLDPVQWYTLALFKSCCQVLSGSCPGEYPSPGPGYGVPPVHLRGTSPDIGGYSRPLAVTQDDCLVDLILISQF